jgi:serine/threonine protein phosphatase PrpC
MKLEVSALTDVGKKRPHNEDSLVADLELGLFAVCDGMGGHAAGEVASQMASSSLTKAVQRKLRQIRQGATGDYAARKAVLGLLSDAVREASRQIHESGTRESAHRGMGTTLTAMVVHEGRGFVAHVGDSRLYLFRNGQVHQVTSDHTILNEMLRSGRGRDLDVNKVKHLNALTRAVGVYPQVEVDTLDLDLLPGDVYLLCSDGLHGYFDTFDLKTFLAHTDPDTCAADLIAFANKQGGRDNISVVTLFVREAGDDASTARARLTLGMLREIPLFHYLSFSELLRLITVCHVEEVEAAARVIEEGDEGRDFYMVVEGALRVHVGGKELAVLDAGRHFGEMSLIDNRPRSASVTAIAPTTLLRIGREDFYELLRQDPVLAVKLLWNFIQTLSSLVRDQARDAGDQTPPVDHPYSGKSSPGSSEV